MKVLVSACLLGMPCRYDGKSKAHPGVLRLEYDWVPVCPEVAGGLSTPRPPAEIRQGMVMTEAGGDVTRQFMLGAQEALRLVSLYDIKRAILKARSPSCGVGEIYDGTFSRRLIKGDGVTTAVLKQAGIEVLTEEDISGDLDCSSESS